MKNDDISASYWKLMPINNESLVNKIIDCIIQAIIEGKFKVGQKLPSEYELINDLNVGRNSLREAIKILSTLGIVEVKRGDGTYVCSQISPRALDPIIYSMIFTVAVNEEMLELRKILDSEVLKLAIEKASDNEIAGLKKHLDLMREVYENKEFRQAAFLDNQFHVEIAKLSRNPYLLRIVEGIYRIFSISIENVISTREAFRDTEKSHLKIIECLEKRDVNSINAVIDLSLIRWKNSKKEG